MLSAQNLSYRRGDKIILADLSFALARGEGLVIAGANGSGKTTLLKILAGLLAPESGKLELDGTDIIGGKSAEYLGRILYLGHKNAMNEELTVLDNLKFWAGLAGNEILIPAALAYFALEEYALMPYKTLSHGLKRRVALARLIFSQKDIWLLDEPFANLDGETGERLANLIATRRQNGMVILSSHQAVALENFKELRLE